MGKFIKFLVMGMTSKKTAPKAEVVAPAVAANPLKKGKREAEEVIEKEVSKKKQKKDVAAKEAAVKMVEVKTQKKKIVKKQESSDDSPSSESEEKQKVVNGKVAGAAKNGTVSAPKKKEESSEESSSEEDSDSSDEDATAAKAPGAVITKNGTAKNKVKDDFGFEDDSSEDEVPEAKKVPAAKTKSVPVKMDVDGSSDDSDSKDSSSDDVAPPKKVPTAVAKKENVVAKKKEETSEDSDSEDDSSEDDVPEAKKVAATITQNVPVKMDEDGSSDESESDDSFSSPKKVPAAVAKKAAVAIKKKKEESSDDTDSDDDAPPKKAPPAVAKKATVAAKKKKEETSDASDSDDDVAETPNTTKSIAKTNAKESGVDDDSSEEESEDEPSKVQAVKKPQIASTKSSSEESSSNEEEDYSEDDKKDSIKTPKKNNNGVEAMANAGKSVPSSEKKKAKTPITPKPQTLCSRSLFVHLGFHVDKAYVENFFKECGEVVDVRFATHPEGGLYGFVDVDFATTVEEAQKALKEKNGHDLAGRIVGLDVAIERGWYTPHIKTPITQKPQTLCSRTLFIHLSFNVEKANVENFFKECGEVVDVGFFKGGGLKGYGHVEFATVEEAQKALKEKNGYDLAGRIARLDLAVESGWYTPDSSDAASDQSGTGSQSGRTIFVRGFDKNVQVNEIKDALREHFSSCGEVTSIVVPTDENGGPKGFAYIDFTTSNAINIALGLDQSELNEYPISVQEAKPGDSSGGHNDIVRGGRGRFSDRGRGRGRFGDCGDRSGGRFGGREGSSCGRGRARGTLSGTGKKTTFGDD